MEVKEFTFDTEEGPRRDTSLEALAKEERANPDQYDKNWRLALGTLGGGNHFIEVCLSDDGQVWLMLHSGSRYVGNALTGDLGQSFQTGEQVTAALLRRLPATALFILMSAIWGVTWIATKAGLGAVPPLFFGAVRYTLVSAVLIIAVGSLGSPWLEAVRSQSHRERCQDNLALLGRAMANDAGVPTAVRARVPALTIAGSAPARSESRTGFTRGPGRRSGGPGWRPRHPGARRPPSAGPRRAPPIGRG